MGHLIYHFLKYPRTVLLLLCFIFSYFAEAQNEISDSSDITRLDLADLMKIKIASNKEQTLEEAPSVVSVITKKDIEAYGCRDISDILRLVPGFEFGIDVFSIVGLSFRGIWVHEGKSLIMLNGLTLNDWGFGNYNFIGTVPASLIERVEIIRGPGSALYGGFAEVCVINIITAPQKSTNSISLTGNGGIAGANGYAANANLYANGSVNDLKYNFNIGYSEKPLSTREYHDFFGNSYQMSSENAFRKFQHIITDISYKGFSFNFNRTEFDYNVKDYAYIIQNFPQDQSTDNNNNNSGVSLKYDIKIGSKLKVTPTIEYISGNAIAAGYFPVVTSTIYSAYGLQKLQRMKGQITAQYDFGKPGELTMGGGYIKDVADNTSVIGTPGLYSSQGDTVFSVYTESKYLLFQHIVKLKNTGLTLGSRYENTSFGEAFAPRAGITFFKNKFNFKVLYGKSYRIPTPWQAYSRELTFVPGAKLSAELSNTGEFEIGYKINDRVSAKINGYYIDIDNPIVYDGLTNSYTNFGKIQSLGTEAEMTVRYNKFNSFINFSYTLPGAKTSDGFLTADKKYFLATPVYKTNLGMHYTFKNLIIGPTFTFLSKRYGESENYAQGLTVDYENTTYDPILLTNLSVTYKVGKININLSAYNLFDQKYVLIQPYYGSHAPLPANDRQIMLGAKLNL